ncbi:MAG: ATP-binding cassette domain-containing protein [bacterium]|nr:ATP-binding cassette domain-containing protein [bacterium]MBU1918701.1 ATP-binding cassette domain-containing protein [bacterium]
MTEAIIKFESVSKSFDGKNILQDISFEVFPGETFCIVGGSGTGKSVALKLLMGLMPVDEGKIFFLGQEVTALNERELNKMRIKIGMVFQSAALFDSMCVYDNVAYPIRELGGYSEDDIATMVCEKLAVVGLSDTASLFPADLSGGMRKRVGLARAIAANPEVIVYDEPTTGLDPANVRRVDERVRLLQEKYKVTSIVVSHDMASIYRVADRVALLHERTFGFIGTLSEFKKATHPLVKQFIHGEIGAE